MIRFVMTDEEYPIQPDDGNADTEEGGGRCITRYIPRAPRPLWNECVRCHRKGTLVETPATGRERKVWRCRKCGDVNPPGEIHDYFDDVMGNEVNMPECPPIMTAAMSRCAKTLFRHSKGEPISRTKAGDTARLLIRLVERYGAEEEEWFDDAEK